MEGAPHAPGDGGAQRPRLPAGDGGLPDEQPQGLGLAARVAGDSLGDPPAELERGVSQFFPFEFSSLWELLTGVLW